MESTMITQGTNYSTSIKDRYQLWAGTHEAYHNYISWHAVEKLHILKFGDGSDGAEQNQGITCRTNDIQSWVLVLNPTKEQVHRILNQCSHLKYLDLRCTQADPLDLSRLTGLEELCISVTEGVYPIKGLEKLEKLKKLDLSFTGCRRLPELPEHLETLDLSGNPDLSDVSGISRLPCLRELDLSCTDVEALDLSGQTGLKRLSLVDTRKLARVAGLEKNPDLEFVDLSCSGIRQLPEQLCDLKKLIRLDLSNMELERFPKNLDKLGMKFTAHDDGINLRRSRVWGLDPSDFEDLTPEKFRALAEAYEQKAERPFREGKVIFLGDGGAGKTRTIARLCNDGGDPDGFTGDTTPGVKVSPAEYDVGGGRMRVHFWDFGGQEHMFPVHFPFLTRDALYVVMLDSVTYPGDQAEYWLSIIDTFAPDAPVLVVRNKTDDDRSAYINASELLECYPNIRGFVDMSALEDDRSDLQKGLIKKMNTALKEMLPVRQPRSMSWHQLWVRLQEYAKQVKVITRAEFAARAQECGVGPESHDEVLDVFNRMGFCFSCAGSPELESYVVLDPNWLTNAMYTIVFNRSVLHKHFEKTIDGVITHEQIKWILDPDHAEEYKIDRVLPEIRYSDEEIRFVLAVMHKYLLSAQLEACVELIPMLCADKNLESVFEAEKQPDAVKYRLSYQSLLPTQIVRLMLERSPELDLTSTWPKGARFERASDGAQAIVRKDDEAKCIRITAFEKGGTTFADSYGKQLIDDLCRISEELNLELESCEIACMPCDDAQTRESGVVMADMERYPRVLSGEAEMVYSDKEKKMVLAVVPFFANKEK